MSNFKWKIFSKFVAFSEYPNFITRKNNHNYLFYTARKDWFDKYYYVAVMLPHVSFNLLAIAVNALLVLSVVKCSRCMMLPWLIANMIWWILSIDNWVPHSGMLLNLHHRNSKIFFRPAKFDNFKDEKISAFKTVSVSQSKNLLDWKLVV